MWVGVEDFSVVDGTIIAVVRVGVWMEINPADGSIREVAGTVSGERRPSDLKCSLLGGYYLEFGYDPPPAKRRIVVELCADARVAQYTPPMAWLLRQWLPANGPPSRALVFHFIGPESESFGVKAYGAAEDKLVAVVSSPSRTFVVCLDIHSGAVLWSHEMPGVVVPDVHYTGEGVEILGGVVNLFFHRGVLDLETGRLLGERPARGAAPRFLREEGGSRLLRVHAGNAFQTGGVTLLEEDANEEVWAVRPPGWRRFGLGLVQSEGQVFVPFSKELTPIVERWARESNKPWLPEARKDPVTHGVMCYRASDGSLEATYGLDYEHLPGAPRRDAPEFVFWQGRDAVSPGTPPIVTHDLVIVPPVRLEWDRDWAYAVAVFSRVSGELLDILWTNVVRRDGAGWTRRLKMELHGNELFVKTKDRRLWCFELPLPPQP